MGIDPALFADAIAEQDEDERPFVVFEENAESVGVFLGCITSWRRTIPPMGGQVLYEGLIKQDVEIEIRMAGFRGRRAREIYADIKIMESSALSVLNEPKKR